MRHRKKLKKLGKKSSHRMSMLNNLVKSVVTHGQITTTLPKAKALRPHLEKMITKAKTNSLANLRNLQSELGELEVVHKLFDIGSKFANRPGGYTRIIKCGYRSGDNAPMAVIQLVE